MTDHRSHPDQLSPTPDPNVCRAKESRSKPAGATCTRCGETSASFCEDWDCHKGWSKP